MKGQRPKMKGVVSVDREQPAIGEFSQTVDDGNTLRVGDYLRAVGLLDGPSPNGHYRRQRREAALAEKRARRAAQRRGEWSRASAGR
jgi:hypothetical protein